MFHVIKIVCSNISILRRLSSLSLHDFIGNPTVILYNKTNKFLTF